MSGEELVGQYFGEDIINEETGEVLVEAGDEITEESDEENCEGSSQADSGEQATGEVDDWVSGSIAVPQQQQFEHECRCNPGACKLHHS